MIIYLQVVGKSLPSDQLIPFLNQLYDALLDPQSHSSSGACVVLNSVVKSRGGELHTEVCNVCVVYEGDVITFAISKNDVMTVVQMLSGDVVK